MTEIQKEYDAATAEMSEAQTLHNRLKARYEMLPSPSDQDEALMLLAKSKLSKAARRVYLARQKLIGEQSILSESSGTAHTDSSTLATPPISMSAMLDDLAKSLAKAAKPTRAEAKAIAAEDKKVAHAKKMTGLYLDHGGEGARTVKMQIDLAFERGGYCYPWKDKEEWDVFYTQHIPPTDQEIGMRLAKGLDRVLQEQREEETKEFAEHTEGLSDPSIPARVADLNATEDVIDTEEDPNFDSLGALPPPTKAEKRVVLDDDAIERGRIANNSDDWRKSDANKNPNDSSRG